MKKIVKKQLALALASVFLTAGAAGAFAGGPDSQPGVGYMSGSSDTQPGVGYMTNSSDALPGAGNMGDSIFSGGGNTAPNGSVPYILPLDPNSLANMYGSNMSGSYPGGMSGYPSSGGGMPTLDLRQVVQQGIQRLPQQQRYYGASNMANQNLAQLGNGMSPLNQIRNSVRDSIMVNRVNDISRMGQATFRPMVQPGAVQSMISQIQPWNFPYRFQSAMMPAMIPMVSGPIKQRQMAYMQAGIMNNPYFPNVPLPMPMYGSSGGYGSYGGGGYYDPYNGGMPGVQGMYGGGMPGAQGMYGGYSNGMMPMQNMMMPNMQNMQGMMMQNMMPSMMQNMPYGY